MRTNSSLVAAFAALTCIASSSLLGCGGSTAADTAPADGGDNGDTTASGGETSTSGGDSTAGDDSSAGGDSSSISDSLGAPTDSTTTTGDAPSTNIQCGPTKVCSGGQICCVTPSGGAPQYACTTGSCADGGIPAACDGPENCSASAKYCCAKVHVEGTPPGCRPVVQGAACAADCNTTIPFTCPADGKARLCHKGVDCADDPNNKNCCQPQAGAGNPHVCVSDQIKGFLNPAACVP